MRHARGSALEPGRRSKLPLAAITGSTFVLCVLVPCATLLLFGGRAEARHASAVFLAGMGIVVIEVGAVSWLDRRDLTLLNHMLLYGVALLLWGVGRWYSSTSTMGTILIIVGAAILAATGIHRSSITR